MAISSVTEDSEASSENSGEPRWRVSGKGHKVAGVQRVVGRWDLLDVKTVAVEHLWGK